MKNRVRLFTAFLAPAAALLCFFSAFPGREAFGAGEETAEDEQRIHVLSAGAGKYPGGREDIVVIRLKKKGKITGIIREKDEKGLVVDVGFGIVSISAGDIEKIEVPECDREKREFMEEWNKRVSERSDKDKIKEKEAFFRRIQEAAESRSRATEVKFTDRSRIVVKALLDGRVETRLLVDTGATLVYISPEIAGKLDMETTGRKTIPIKLADGNLLHGIPVRLRSVKIGDAEAVDVSAAILPGKPAGLHGKHKAHGILGMSFLKHFHIRIDPGENTLTLIPK